MGETTSMDMAVRELQVKQYELSKTFKSLKKLGLEGDCEMPQLVIVGMQSSGKSSVLERISRVRLPTDNTRSVTEVMLHRRLSPDAKITYESLSSNSGQETLFTSDVKPEELAVNNLFPVTGKIHKNFLKEKADATPKGYVLKIEIAGSKYPDMTLIELPGLRIPGKDESSEEDSFVHVLAEKYMKNKASLILAVVSAKIGYQQQEEVLKLAERFDPTHKRTIGIITHTDTLQRNSEQENTFIELVRNQKAQLKLGWHALWNGASHDRHSSEELCNKKEMVCFCNGAWATVPTCCVGLGALQTRLNRAVFDCMKQYIPDMAGNVEKTISENNAKLEKLGPSRTTIQEKRAYLLGVGSKCERIMAQALNGMYSDGFFTSEAHIGAHDFRKLRSVVRELNDDFAEAMELRGAHRIIVHSDAGFQNKDTFKREANPYLDGWEPVYITRKAFEAEVAEQARRSRGVEIPGHINQRLIESLFRTHSKPWEELARRHVMTVGEAVEHFVHLLFEYLVDDQVLSALSHSILGPALNKMKDTLSEKLQELTAFMKQGHPQLLGQIYLTQIQKSQSKRQFQDLRRRLGLPLSPNQNPSTKTISLGDLMRATSSPEPQSTQFSAAEIIDQMQAYYDVSQMQIVTPMEMAFVHHLAGANDGIIQLAIVIFMNNVANLAIENCLLQPLESIFTSASVVNMDDQHIEDLASEPTVVQEQRERLSYQLEKLQAGQGILKSYDSPQSRPEGPNIFPELERHCRSKIKLTCFIP
jgi:GTPase SAR1 family protein